MSRAARTRSSASSVRAGPSGASDRWRSSITTTSRASVRRSGRFSSNSAHAGSSTNWTSPGAARHPWTAFRTSSSARDSERGRHIGDEVMRILLMCEEDPESWASWSGITKSIVDHLRLEGHTVITQDIDLYGADRLLAGVATFSPDRRTWGTRFHLGAVPFRLRSRNANRAVAAHRDQIDLVLQIGATFQISRRFGIPYVMCCDSNIRVAQQGAATGFSNASAISAAALESIAARERVVYQGAAAIFPLCEHLRRSFIDDFQIPADRVHAVYAGPNFASGSIAAVPPSRRDAHPPTALFVGLQFHRKGGDLLVESFRRVRAQLPDARLILAGVPVGYVEGPGITCLGDLNKNRPEGAAALADAYASADVFALPTRFEPFGIA